MGICKRSGRDAGGRNQYRYHAAVVRLMERPLARVGNPEYAKQNNSFGLDMCTIKIRVPAADFGAEMAAMRKWLDEHTCEPRRFTSQRRENVVTVCVGFDKDCDGKAFKADFDCDTHQRTVVQTWDRMVEDLERQLTEKAR
jgi:hypothetical protein